MKALVLPLFLVVFTTQIVLSDQANDVQPIKAGLIVKGTNLLNEKNFGEALPVWLQLFKDNPTNSNISFKLGLCYFYTLDKQTKALPYFKIASKNITANYNFYNTGEFRAPVDAIYYLAESYLYLNRADSALKYFYLYKDEFGSAPPLPVDGKIRECLNAIELTNNPLQVKYENFGEVVNSAYAETNPVIAFDNSYMFFSSRRLRKDRSNENLIDKSTGTFLEDIYYSKFNGFWTEPELFDYNTNVNNAPLCISADGTKLYIKRDDNRNANIFVSEFKDGVWNKPEALGRKINSLFNETGISVTSDESILIFASDRSAGHGGSDLYMCRKGKSGTWEKPQNLGSVINTNGNEINPYVYPNGKKLIFSSNGHENVGMGGYDILSSELQSDGKWSKPVNVGYPINTSGDDKYYYITSEGKRYCASISSNLDYDLFEIVKGEFEALNLKPGTSLEISKEVDVMDIVEIEREVEKEIEVKEIIEKEIEIEKEVEVIKFMDTEGENMNPEVAKAQAEKAKAEAEKAQAEADKLKAQAQIALAEAEKIKADAEIAKAEAEKLKAEVEIMKIELDTLLAHTEKIKSEALIAEAEIARLESEKAKAEAEKAKADIAITKEERKKAKYDAKIAEVAKAKSEAEKASKEKDIAVAESEKAKAEAGQVKARSDQAVAEAEKLKAEAEKLQAEANIKMGEIEKLKLEINENETSIKNYEAEEAKARAAADQAKAEADKINAELALLNAQIEKNKAESVQVTAKTEQLKAEADKAKAETEQMKTEAQLAQAEAGKAKEEANKLKEQAGLETSEVEKIRAEAGKAKEEANKIKEQAGLEASEAEKIRAGAGKTKEEANKLNAQAELEKAEAEKAKAEIGKLNAQTENAKADAEKAKAEADRANAEAGRLKAEAEKLKAEAEKLKSEAEKIKAEAEKAKTEAENKE